jgi:hypothetical protein
MTFACACEHCGHEFEAEPEGGHRLLCGDATKADDHARVIGGGVIDAVITDPPYGVGIDYKSFNDSPEDARTLIAGFMPLVLRWPVVALTSGHRVLWSYPRPDWIMAWIHQAATSCGPWGFLCFNPILRNYVADAPSGASKTPGRRLWFVRPRSPSSIDAGAPFDLNIRAVTEAEKLIIAGVLLRFLGGRKWSAACPVLKTVSVRIDRGLRRRAQDDHGRRGRADRQRDDRIFDRRQR